MRNNKTGFILGSNHKEKILNSAYFIFLFFLFAKLCRSLFFTHGYENWGISDFLINYQGGFVRRGLFGEILLFLTNNFNINTEWAIKIFSLTCFVAVCAFFVMAFRKKNWSMYILPLCIFLGSGVLANCWIRKDYFFICIFISIFWIYTKNTLPEIIKFLIINILASFVILSHEVFAFFSLPLLFLLFFNKYKENGVLLSGGLSFLYLLPQIFIFSLTLIMHGNQDAATAIFNSWAGILNLDNLNTIFSVEAIGWSKEFAFKKHLYNNFLFVDEKIIALLVSLITFFIVYYISANAISTFRKKQTDFTSRDKNILSSILIFQFLCLLPLWTVLSCDYFRVVFYWTASSYAAFLLISRNDLEKLFPKFFVNFAGRINNVSTSILHPSKTTLVFLMMLIGLSPTHLFSGYLKTTMLYNILLVLSMPLVLIKNVLFSYFAGI